MCWCTPNLRTPWCGKPGCEAPALRQRKEGKRWEIEAEHRIALRAPDKSQLGRELRAEAYAVTLCEPDRALAAHALADELELAFAAFRHGGKPGAMTRFVEACRAARFFIERGREKEPAQSVTLVRASET